MIKESLMEVYPLESISVEEALRLQFKMVDCASKYFTNNSSLTLGEVGISSGGKPSETTLVEKTIADFFGQERCLLVRGAGTGAIQMALRSVLSSGSTLMVHDAPVYPTTIDTIESMGLRTEVVDYNTVSEGALRNANTSSDAALVQLTRQKPNDSYSYEEVVGILKSSLGIPVVTDDNYAVMKVGRIGVEVGADLSCFSAFKLLGPVGVGVIVGGEEYVSKIEGMCYSGGSKVQGYEGLEVLRGMIYAPVALAHSAIECEKLVNYINGGALKGVKGAFIVNAQSRVVMVELENPNASEVISRASKFGANTYPVGAESKYEFLPMIYRASGTFVASDPERSKRLIRVNPMRSSAETVIHILQKALQEGGK